MVIVDDVITSGRSIRESVEVLRRQADVTITGVVVAMDREERGRGSKTTLHELQEEGYLLAVATARRNCTTSASRIRTLVASRPFE